MCWKSGEGCTPAYTVAFLVWACEKREVREVDRERKADGAEYCRCRFDEVVSRFKEVWSNVVRPMECALGR